MALSESQIKEKDELRREARRWREGLTAEQRRSLNGKIRLYVTSLPDYRGAHRILFYAAFRNEVDTWSLMRAAAGREKMVYLPRTHRKDRQMQPVPVQWEGEKPANLHRGAYGICEPCGRAEDPGRMDLVFVPGLVFDRQGYRIGFGGGYYDRFLAGLAADVPRVGLCYSGQLKDRVPRGDHDLPVDVVVTEQGVLRAEAYRRSGKEI